jgi:hypothetical protein
MPTATYVGSFHTVGKLNPGTPDVKHNYVTALTADPFGWLINTTASGQSEIERLTPQRLGGVQVAAAGRIFSQVVSAPDGSAGFIETARVPEIINGTLIGWTTQSVVGARRCRGRSPRSRCRGIRSKELHRWSPGRTAGSGSSVQFLERASPIRRQS